MRSFPRTAGRRVGIALLSATLALGAAAPMANAGDGREQLKHKRKLVQGSIKSAKQDLHESSRRLATAIPALDTAKTQLVSARAGLQTARTKLAEAKVLDARMQAQLADAQEKLRMATLAQISGEAALTRQREDVEDMITSIYVEGDPSLLAISSLMDAETPEDLVRQAGARDVMVGTETQTYDDLRAAEVMLKVRASEVEQAKDEVQEKADAAAAHLKLMAQLKVDKRDARDDVVALVATRAEASKDARAAKRADRRKLKKAEAEDARIRKELARLARLARIRAMRKGTTTGSTSGFLSHPVPGAVTSGFGYRIHPIYGYWGLHDGTDFGVACGEPLHSAADGKVISSYWSDVYGNRLVIDNGLAGGTGIATIYNHASSYTVGVGDTVKRGQVIGYVGSTGWSTGCHLHFTVMANGKPVDPMTWL